jgi:hypothetical protein
MQNETVAPEVAQTPEKTEYEAPAIERVMSADELTREVQYAGAPDGTIIIG